MQNRTILIDDEASLLTLFESWRHVFPRYGRHRNLRLTSQNGEIGDWQGTNWGGMIGASSF